VTRTPCLATSLVGETQKESLLTLGSLGALLTFEVPEVCLGIVVPLLEFAPHLLGVREELMLAMVPCVVIGRDHTATDVSGAFVWLHHSLVGDTSHLEPTLDQHHVVQLLLILDHLITCHRLLRVVLGGHGGRLEFDVGDLVIVLEATWVRTTDAKDRVFPVELRVLVGELLEELGLLRRCNHGIEELSLLLVERRGSLLGLCQRFGGVFHHLLQEVGHRVLSFPCSQESGRHRILLVRRLFPQGRHGGHHLFIVVETWRGLVSLDETDAQDDETHEGDLHVRTFPPPRLHSSGMRI